MAIENFTTYTEVDPNSKITVASSKVSWDDLSRNEEAYVYKDKGYDFFDKDFTHKLKVQFSDYGSGSSCRANHWAVADVLDDEYGWITGFSSAVNLLEYNNDYRIYLQIIDVGAPTSDGWTGAEPSVTYYITITRDRDGGVNNRGRYTAYICTNGYYGEGGNLEDTLQVDSQSLEPDPVDYQYIFACNTYNDGNPMTIDGFTEDLDLGLAGFNPAFARANNLIGGF